MPSTLTTASARSRSRASGQVMVLFALSLVALLAMTALLFDGAQALVERRLLQNTADAAAYAAANGLGPTGNPGCSNSAGPPPGAPTSTVTSVAKDTVVANLPDYARSAVIVSCPDGWNNQAVTVSLSATPPALFGSVLGLLGLTASASGTALNGGINVANYSVLSLDPDHLGWPSGYNGCPAVLFSGGPSVTFDGSLQADSACPAGSGGALGTNGNSAVLTFTTPAHASLVGGYAPGPLTISPAPLTGQAAVADPLTNLPPLPLDALPVRSASKLTLNNQRQLLLPGIYTGGIQLKNKSEAYLSPGIYVLDGGGLQVGAQAKIFSLKSGLPSTSEATWASDCPSALCGVLIANIGTSATMGGINVDAGATAELLPYQPSADPLTPTQAYQNLLFWQAASPVPTASYVQPTLSMHGGGTMSLTGTVYTPSAIVLLSGSPSGQGGGLSLTLQFICWDLQIQGNASFHFFYHADAFIKAFDYGLVQ
jgi:hypothetical protein